MLLFQSSLRSFTTNTVKGIDMPRGIRNVFWIVSLLFTSILIHQTATAQEFPPKKSEFKLSIVFEAAKNEKAGVAGVVSVGEKD